MQPSPAPWRGGRVLPLRRVVVLVVVALLLLPAMQFGSPAGAAGAGAAPLPQTHFTLDGVTVTVRSPFLPVPAFSTAAPGDASQVAAAVTRGPYRELAVIAVPFGTRPGTERLPTAQAGGADTYRAALRDFRAQQGGSPAAGPAAMLFGRRVASLVSLVTVNLDGPTAKPAQVVEWVVAAGPRLWIVRAGRAVLPGPADAAVGSAFLVDLQALVLESDTLDQPTTVPRPGAPGGPPARPAAPGAPGAPAAPADLPPPSWWHGSDCDYDHYYGGSGRIGSYRLGAVYQGLPACGPRPVDDHAPDVLVFFFAGAWGEYEWECTELAFRYLYLAYGVAPYRANGSQVVWNYHGSLLQAVANGTPGRAPQAGDVLSYGPLDTFGHASVVTAASVDSNGNGSLTVIEENSSATGSRTLTVQGWWVGGGGSAVTGWLTPAAGGPTATPPPSATAMPIATATPAGSPTPAGATATPPGTEPPATPSATAIAPAGTTTPPTATATPGTPGACTLAFADVPAESAFHDAILRLACRGIISGYTCGGPDDPCDGQNDPYFRSGAGVTRGQLLKMVVNTAGWPITLPGGPTFADVPPQQPFAPFVETGAARAIISGYGCGGPFEPCDPATRPYFRPGAGVTRGQVSKILAVAWGYPLLAPDPPTFADVPATQPFFGYIEALAAHGVVSGYACGAPAEPCDAAQRPYFRPGPAATRGQVAKFLDAAAAGP